MKNNVKTIFMSIKLSWKYESLMMYKEQFSELDFFCDVTSGLFIICDSGWNCSKSGKPSVIIFQDRHYCSLMLFVIWNFQNLASALLVPEKLWLNWIMSLNMMILCSKLKNIFFFKIATKWQIVTKFKDIKSRLHIYFFSITS